MRGRGIARSAVATAVATVGLLLIPAVASAGQLSYTFTDPGTGLGTNQGWQVRGDAGGPLSPATANNTGGNPGGTLFFNDAAANQTARFQSPAFAAGTLAANYGGSLSFDLHISGAPAVGEIIVFINQGTSASLVTRIQPTGPQGAFQRISFPLQARAGTAYSGIVFDLTASEAQWRTVLGAATSLTVQFDAHPNSGDVYLLDNFLVTEPPAAPVPPTAVAPTTATAKKCKKKGKKGAEASKKKRKKCKRKKRR